MFEVPIEGVQDEAEGGFCPDASGGTIAPDFKKNSSLVHPGYPHDNRDQIQPDLASQHTHDCLLGRRNRVTVRAGLAIPRRVQPC